MIYLSYEQKNSIEDVLRGLQARQQMLQAVETILSIKDEKRMDEHVFKRRSPSFDSEEEPETKKQRTLDPDLDEIADAVGTVFGWEDLMKDWDPIDEEI
mmetsp:Transcript_20104/g.29835  ORF Transcript_20104/g.29835 Transcript_20104/m.29835 type:complete len:99 (-) Transcript_20104:142-438(-)